MGRKDRRRTMKTYRESILGGKMTKRNKKLGYSYGVRKALSKPKIKQ